VRDSVEVKLYEHGRRTLRFGEKQRRQAKENAMRRKRLARLLRRLRAMRRRARIRPAGLPLTRRM
jgi:hypothetical protein